MFKEDYENIPDRRWRENLYEKVVGHGPLDISVAVGNSHPDFQKKGSGRANMYFSKPTFCEGISMYIGSQDLLTSQFGKDKFYFDQCRVEKVGGIYFNVWSFSMGKQFEIMKNKKFKLDEDKDPMFQMQEYRIMYDPYKSDVTKSNSPGKYWEYFLYYYPNNMISVVSVNCTTINMEFKPSVPKRSNLFEFDPIRYLCYGNKEYACRYNDWTAAAAKK